jgi:hypothetical protein
MPYLDSLWSDRSMWSRKRSTRHRRSGAACQLRVIVNHHSNFEYKTSELLLYGDGRDLYFRAANQAGNLHRSARWFWIGHELFIHFIHFFDIVDIGDIDGYRNEIRQFEASLFHHLFHRRDRIRGLRSYAGMLSMVCQD